MKKIIDLKAVIEKDHILLMGKRMKQGMDFFHFLFKTPVVTAKNVQTFSGLSIKAAHDLIKVFVDHKILVEITGYQRNRIFVFEKYTKLF